MGLGEIYLGVDTDNLELLTAFSREFKTSNKQLSRSERTASGRLVRDIITTKKEFVLSYELIYGDELDVFLDLYDEEDELVLRVYTGAATYDDYTVLIEPVDFTRVLMFDDGLWGGVEIVLVEV